MTSRRRLIPLVLAALAAWGPATVTSAAEPYTLLSLGTLGGFGSAGYALNNKGQAVGGSTTAAGAAHAYLWENGKMVDLGTLGGTQSVAFGINERGQVVGTADTMRDAARHAFLWENGRMKDLGTLGGSFSAAYTINNRGQIVGASLIAGDSVSHAFLWENGKMTDLGTLGGSTSSAYGINDRGQVVGAASTPNEDVRATLWENGTKTDLGTLGGSQSLAYSINNRGQVAGEAWTAGNTARRAFVWENGKMTDLGTLGGLVSGTSATGLKNVQINGLGQVVGYAATALQTLHPFLWDPTDGMRDLHTLIAPGSGWELLEALGLMINDAGEILGDGNFKLQRLAYLLNPPTGRVLSRETATQARESIDRLRKDVQGVSPSSPDGTLLYLIDALSAAETRLVDGKTTSAMNLLQAFILQVDAVLQGRAGDPPFARSDGQRWIDVARAIVKAVNDEP